MKNVIYALLTVLTVYCMSSCKDMDNTYKELIVPNGLKYPQKPDSLKAFPGYNKMRITWLKAKDPSVVCSKIYWNNYQDSLRVDIPQNKDTIVTDISGLGEGTYTFYVKAFDKYGNSSIPSEVTGTPYGDNYLVSVTDRTIGMAMRDGNRTGTITWNAKTVDLLYSEVRYKVSSGEIKTIRAFPGEKTSVCPDIKPRELFEYRSVFLPPNGIDSVGREWVTSARPFNYEYPRGSWTAASRNGNHNWGSSKGEPKYIFDYDYNTGWHSKVGAPFPQCLVADMKSSLVVDYVNFAQREQVSERYMKDVQVYLTDTPVNPDDPNLLSILSSMTPAAVGRCQGEQVFRLNFPTPQSGRYMVILFPNYLIGGGYISFMELEVYGF